MSAEKEKKNICSVQSTFCIHFFFFFRLKVSACLFSQFSQFPFLTHELPAIYQTAATNPKRTRSGTCFPQKAAKDIFPLLYSWPQVAAVSSEFELDMSPHLGCSGALKAFSSLQLRLVFNTGQSSTFGHLQTAREKDEAKGTQTFNSFL